MNNDNKDSNREIMLERVAFVCILLSCGLIYLGG